METYHLITLLPVVTQDQYPYSSEITFIRYILILGSGRQPAILHFYGSLVPKAAHTWAHGACNAMHPEGHLRCSSACSLQWSSAQHDISLISRFLHTASWLFGLAFRQPCKADSVVAHFLRLIATSFSVAASGLLGPVPIALVSWVKGWLGTGSEAPAHIRFSNIRYKYRTYETAIVSIFTWQFIHLTEPALFWSSLIATLSWCKGCPFVPQSTHLG